MRAVLHGYVLAESPESETIEIEGNSGYVAFALSVTVEAT